MIYSDKLRNLNLADDVPPITRSIAKIFPEIRVDVVSSSVPPDSFNCGSEHFVSEKLKTIISKLDCEIEAIKTNVLHKAKPIENHYYVLNVLSHSQCVDLGKSDLEIEDNCVEEINSLILNDNARGICDLFVLDISPTTLVISEKAKLEMQNNGVTGCAYIPFSSYNDTWMFNNNEIEF